MGRGGGLRPQRAGREVPLTEQADVEPDEVLVPHAEIMGQFEIDLGLITPTIQYAMIDNALRFHEGQSMEDHKSELGSLWGGFNEAAVANESAWNRTPMTPEEIVTPTEGNRMLAYPYTKSLVSQWNVNQSAGLVLCSYEKAQALGVDEAALDDAEEKAELIAHPWETRSDSFYFVDGRLVMQNKANDLSARKRRPN